MLPTMLPSCLTTTWGLDLGPLLLLSRNKISLWLPSCSILGWLANAFLFSRTSLQSYSMMTAICLHSISLCHRHKRFRRQCNYTFLISQTWIGFLSYVNTLSFMSEDLSKLFIKFCLLSFCPSKPKYISVAYTQCLAYKKQSIFVQQIKILYFLVWIKLTYLWPIFRNIKIKRHTIWIIPEKSLGFPKKLYYLKD